MTERAGLESMLSSLADSIDWPSSSPRLAAKVLARVESKPGGARRRGWRRLTVAVAAVVLFAGAMVLSPSARQAMADLFSVAGIRIGFTSEPATPGADLNLGEPIHLSEVGQRVDFVVRVPAGGEPGPPDGVYLRDDQITMVWAGDGVLPAAGGTEVALLLSQHRGRAGRYLGEKGVGGDTKVASITVEGSPSVWIEGAPHTLTMVDADGSLLLETTRLAANVLVWEANGVAYRLETTGDLQSALGIVERLEPVK